MPDDRVTSDYLPNPQGAVHGPLWMNFRESDTDDTYMDASGGLMKNRKTDPHSFIGDPEDPMCYGGSDH